MSDPELGGQGAMRDRWITDWTPSARFPVYTRANADEVLATPCSPLGWTFVWEQAAMPGYRDAFIDLGVMLPRELTETSPPLMGIFGGYLYNNLSSIRTWASRLPGGTVELADKSFLGNRPDRPPHSPHPDDQAPEALAKAAAAVDRALEAEELPGLEADRAAAAAARADRPSLTGLSAAELVERARSMLPLVRSSFATNAFVGPLTSIGPAMLEALGSAVGRPGMTAQLIAALGDVDSALPAYEIWQLSRLVARSTQLTSIFGEGMDGLTDRLRAAEDPATAEFLQAFEQFLHGYGSRGPNEWDLAAEVWETHPELALRLVDRVRLADDSASPRARHEASRAEREQLVAELTELVTGNAELGGLLDRGLSASRRFYVARERAKTTCIKALHEVRMSFRQLGNLAYADGALSSPSQVMMLKHDELDTFAAAPGAFREVLAERSVEFRALFDLEPPYFVDSVVPPLSAWPRRTTPHEPVEGDTRHAPIQAGAVLTGVAGAPGKARGQARVVSDVATVDDLAPGDILVAYTTDPSWTPLFLTAAGVVANVGAMSSHAVIVSRELGIPCVPSVSGATELIPNGADISVDGDLGTVTIHATTPAVSA